MLRFILADKSLLVTVISLAIRHCTCSQLSSHYICRKKGQLILLAKTWLNEGEAGYFLASETNLKRAPVEGAIFALKRRASLRLAVFKINFVGS
jgi:hypothetical protein